MLFEEIDNMVWSDKEKEITKWCKRNKVFDEITEEEIQEIWKRENPDNEEPIRLNGKFVWETAKRGCQYINTHDDLVHITSFGEYRMVMNKVMRVIREAHNAEKKRRKMSQKRKNEDVTKRIQRTKTLISRIKRGEMRVEDIKRRLDEIFGKGSSQEIERATTNENRLTE